MNTCWEYGNYDLVWIIGLLDFGMDKSNHKPIFFFINLGLKEPYLVYWWCLVVLDQIWRCFGLVLRLIGGCMETKYGFPNFLRLRKLS